MEVVSLHHEINDKHASVYGAQPTTANHGYHIRRPDDTSLGPVGQGVNT